MSLAGACGPARRLAPGPTVAPQVYPGPYGSDEAYLAPEVRTAQSTPWPTAEPASTRPSPTRTPTRLDRPSATPTPYELPSSPLLLDSAGGRIFASVLRGSAAELRVFGSADGGLLASMLLRPDEVLLGLDDAGGRLFVWSERGGLRVLASADRRELDRMPLAAMRPTLYGKWYDSLIGYGRDASHRASRPILRLPAGELLVVEGTVLQAYRPDQGRAVAVWSLDLGDRVKGLYALTVTQDGAMLYVQRRSVHTMEPDPEPPAEVIVLRLPSGREMGRVLGGGRLSVMERGRHVLADDRTYKHPVQNTLVLSGGRETRRVAGFDLDLGPLDTRRDRLVATWPSSRADVSFLAMLDPDTLDILQLRPWTAARSPELYDPVNDLLFSWAPDLRRLEISPAAGLEPSGAAAPAEPLDPAEVELIRFPVTSAGQVDPGFRLGRLRRMATPTPAVYPPGLDLAAEAVSRDGGLTWTSEVPESLGSWPASMLASAEFFRDNTLYAQLDGLGVWRSRDAGRSWQPASTGLGAMSLRALHLAPQTTGELFAEAAYGDAHPDHPILWRSRDGGRSWSPLGAYRSLSFAPDYARSRMILGFQEGRAFVSRDGGDSWQRRGRLPGIEGYPGTVGSSFVIPMRGRAEPLYLAIATTDSMIGGDVHWPESGTRLFSSGDGGVTWDLAWLPDQDVEIRDRVYGWEGRLIGPVADADSPEIEQWFLIMSGQGTASLIIYPPEFYAGESDFDLTHWHELSTKDSPMLIGVAGPGRLLGFDRARHATFERSVEELEARP